MLKRQILLDWIVIPAYMKESKPSESKMEQKRLEAEPEIIVTDNYVLRDGYAGLLALKERGCKWANVYIHDAKNLPRPRTYVYGRHGGWKIECYIDVN